MNIGLIENWHEIIHPVNDKKFARWLLNKKMLCLTSSDIGFNLQDFIDHINCFLEDFYFFNPWGHPTRELFYFKPKLAIFRIFYHEDLYIVHDKTHLLSKIQKKWKRYYAKLQKKKKIAKKTKSIIYREIYGKLPKN